MSRIVVQQVRQRMTVQKGAPSTLRVTTRTVNKVTIKTTGVRGPQGERGEQGPPGPAGTVDDMPDLTLILMNSLV